MKAVKSSIIFVALMAITFVACSPFLLFASERKAAFNIQLRQSEAMSDGFVLSYAKGPAAWFSLIDNNYAQPLFLLASLVSLGIGIAKKETRLLSLLIATWSIPFMLYLLFTVVIKPKHFFIPILLPVFSTLPFLFDAVWPRTFRLVKANLVKFVLLAVTLVVVLTQVIYNFNFDAKHYLAELNKEKDSQAIQFYEKLDEIVFSKISADDHLVIFRDVHTYVKDLPRWDVKYRWGLYDYTVIKNTNADVLILWKQMLYDYTQAGAAERALDQIKFSEAKRFYNDALNHNVEGYHLIYQDDFGFAYISVALYDRYFK